MDPERTGEPSRAAQQVFARYLAEEAGAGDASGDREVLEEHPELRGELAVLQQRWQVVRSLLGDLAHDEALIASVMGQLPGPIGPEARAVLERLQRLRPTESLHEVLGEAARGGMGLVERVRDRALDRVLARKRLHAVVLPGGSRLPLDGKRLERFLREAQICGALGHPGVLPVHELGVDEHCEPYFTMPLVEGRTLAEILRLARGGSAEWTPGRILEVLIKVCDTLAYAHQRDVVHRDVKPENVHVGRFGEVYLLDWGLARSGSEPEPEAARANRADGPADLTLEGEVLGTPLYMAPEQARGDRVAVGPLVDVYALGAILYEFLAGRPPYAGADGSSGSSSQVLESLRAGPPVELDRIAPDAPRELVSICRRAMAREPARRYPSAVELGADLRAFVEGRVVRAHDAGVLATLRKWVRRNPWLAASIAALAVVMPGGTALLLHEQGQRAEALQERVDVLAPVNLRARAPALWPALPRNVVAMEGWLADVEDLRSRVPLHASALASLRAQGRAGDAGDSRERSLRADLEARLDAVESRIAGHRENTAEISAFAPSSGREHGLAWAAEEIARLTTVADRIRARLARPRTWRFEDPVEQHRHDSLQEFVEAFEDLDAPGEGWVERVRRARDQALALGRRSLEDSAAAWHQTCALIADPLRSPRYAGLQLRPQVGLIPLGPDPRSGLHEFAHLATGEPPARALDGRLRIGPESGLVLVLVPGGSFVMGGDPLGGHIPGSEAPAHEVPLAPFFLAKHEMTQAQWLRAAGENPSYYHPGWSLPVEAGIDVGIATWIHPVESVSWSRAVAVLRSIDLELPTEAQWEYAARAGTRLKWVTAADVCDLHAIANINQVAYPESCRGKAWSIVAPIGGLEPNPWGFHDVLGNVAEWTLDCFASSYRHPHRAGDGLIEGPDFGLRTVRGGNFWTIPEHLSVATRGDYPGEVVERMIGVRPARRVDADDGPR